MALGTLGRQATEARNELKEQLSPPRAQDKTVKLVWPRDWPGTTASLFPARLVSLVLSSTVVISSVQKNLVLVPVPVKGST